jgi:hypothetical protein
MSATNFHPNLWADKTLNEMKRELENTVRLVSTITDYTKFIKGKNANGYTGLKIGAMKAVNLPAKEDDINEPQKSTFNFLFDQHKGVPFIVEDIDDAQTNINLMDHFTKDAKDGILDIYDAFILENLLNGAETKLKMSQSSSQTVLDDILKLRETLNKAGAPREGRYLVVSPTKESQLYKIPEFISRDKISDTNAIKKGVIGEILGFTVLAPRIHRMVADNGKVSANASENTKDVMIAYQSLTFAFGRQLEFKSTAVVKPLTPGTLVNIWSVFGGTKQEASYAVSMRNN